MTWLITCLAIFLGANLEAKFRHSTPSDGEGSPLLRQHRQRRAIQGWAFRKRIPHVRISQADHREDPPLLEWRHRPTNKEREENTRSSSWQLSQVLHSITNELFGNGPHLSKRKSDLKQKCSQLLTPLSGTVFHALSHGGIHFAQSVGFENQLNRSFWLAVREFPPVRKWFWG